MIVKSPFASKLTHVGVVVRDMDKTSQRLEPLDIGPNQPPFNDTNYNLIKSGDKWPKRDTHRTKSS